MWCGYWGGTTRWDAGCWEDITMKMVGTCRDNIYAFAKFCLMHVDSCHESKTSILSLNTNITKKSVFTDNVKSVTKKHAFRGKVISEFKIKDSLQMTYVDNILEHMPQKCNKNFNRKFVNCSVVKSPGFSLLFGKDRRRVVGAKVESIWTVFSNRCITSAMAWAVCLCVKGQLMQTSILELWTHML